MQGLFTLQFQPQHIPAHSTPSGLSAQRQHEHLLPHVVLQCIHGQLTLSSLISLLLIYTFSIDLSSFRYLASEDLLGHISKKAWNDTMTSASMALSPANSLDVDQDLLHNPVLQRPVVYSPLSASRLSCPHHILLFHWWHHLPLMHLSSSRPRPPPHSSPPAYPIPISTCIHCPFPPATHVGTL
ncbi:hypothetical protein CVT26_002514 [Gymnopilus dilepis]|uniref:Uncharacterized protein n=1 Tax=Gymnopilus dilepis TaxID=231916 RepID=A0A409YN81_9AGAR|nr:hypothetical protein CVT26_002514 [Gymnopilus dilepis]